MIYYQIPSKYYFRLNHVRPRFKGDIENVLIYMAEKITAIGECAAEEFAEKMNQAIVKYPGNAHKTKKTINNWRTEISSLFGFIEHHEGIDKPGRRAIELAEDQDLVKAFKIFLYTFQYPGAHIKAHTIQEQIEAGIHFKPAQYILKLFQYANQSEKGTIGLTKGEICHCIFNDLRCTRDNEDVSKTWDRIKKNRKNNLHYDLTGDVIRYAGDIVDYMEIANLLVTYDSNMYYLNTLETESIIKFINSQEWFDEYDRLIEKREGTLSAINHCYDDWFRYVNRDLKSTDFSTDIITYLNLDKEEQSELDSFEQTKLQEEKLITARINESLEDFRTKDIGDIGEGLIHSHECMRMKLGGREDLIHLIKRIPTQLAVGYDISSCELDGRKRYIEVKTTISSKPLHFNRIHMTKNEWNTASSVGNVYYIYRLMLSKKERKLFLLHNPVKLYKDDKINMVPDQGAEITFDPQKVGTFEELLTWKNSK